VRQLKDVENDIRELKEKQWSHGTDNGEELASDVMEAKVLR
jgi:hypothetical protein